MITEDQVRQAVVERQIRAWKLRDCSFCGSPLHYVFEGERIGYDSNCDCTQYWTPISEVSMPDFLDTFNRQKPEIMDRMWAEFLASGPQPNPEITS